MQNARLIPGQVHGNHLVTRSEAPARIFHIGRTSAELRGVAMQVAEPVHPYMIHLEGVFDERSAARLSELLSGAPEGARIALDLSRVRQFQGGGLALLAGALAARTEPLDVRGLGRHEARLLRYLGLAPAAADAPAASVSRT
jgi:hypothetical protein